MPVYVARCPKCGYGFAVNRFCDRQRYCPSCLEARKSALRRLNDYMAYRRSAVPADAIYFAANPPPRPMCQDAPANR